MALNFWLILLKKTQEIHAFYFPKMFCCLAAKKTPKNPPTVMQISESH